MAAKKKRTAKQIAATKKMLAGLKKYRKKKNPAKKNPKKNTAKRNPKKNTAKRNPKKNVTKRNVTKRGHYNYYVVKVTPSGKPATGRKYFDGAGWCADMKNAAVWHSERKAKIVAQAIADQTGLNVGVLKK